MSGLTQTKPTPARRFSLSLASLSFEAWAVAASILFIALIVAGVFPHVPW
jgi:hypothetical protein